jgi:4-amino-4-deoxy-L-arabinose transferase-like glycosyltransferase
LRRSLLLFFIFFIIVAIFRWPSVDELLDNDSGAKAYHARLILQGEPLYTTHHPGHHLPGTYYTYALAFLLFGDNPQAPKLLLIPWVTLNAFLIYQLGRQLKNDTTGLLAAFFFIMVTSHPWIKGTTGQTELFANLPRTASIWLSLTLLQKKSRNWLFIFPGMLCGWALLYKTIYVSSTLVIGLSIFLDSWEIIERKLDFKKFLSRGVWAALGFFLVIGSVVSYYAITGILPRFMEVFTLGGEYVGSFNTFLSWLFILYSPLVVILSTNYALLILSFAGLVTILRSAFKYASKEKITWVYGLSVSAWFTLSIIEAGIPRSTFEHYALLVIPPLAILAAFEIMVIQENFLKRRNTPGRGWHFNWAIIWLIAIIEINAFLGFQYYTQFTRYKLGLATYTEFLSSVPRRGKLYVNAVQLSDYIKTHTSSEDRIFLWSDNVMVYYYADRRSPIDLIWPVNIQARGNFEHIFTPQTKYVIFGDNSVSKKPAWLPQDFDQLYEYETSIGDALVYKRISSQEASLPNESLTYPELIQAISLILDRGLFSLPSRKRIEVLLAQPDTRLASH